MGWGLLVSVSAASSDGNAVTSGNINTSGCNALRAILACGSTGVVVDNKGNTWVLDESSNNGTPTIKIFRAVSPVIVGSGHNFSFSGSSGELPAIWAGGFTGGAKTSPLDDVNNGDNGAGGTDVEISSGLTPSEAQELGLAGVVLDTGFTHAFDEVEQVNQYIVSANIASTAHTTGLNWGLTVAYDLALRVGLTTTPRASFTSSIIAAIAFAMYKSQKRFILAPN